MLIRSRQLQRHVEQGCPEHCMRTRWGRATPTTSCLDMLTTDQCFAIVLCTWLGGYARADAGPQSGRLLTIEEVGEIMNGSHVSV